MPRLSLSGRPAHEVAADLLVLPVAAGDDGPVAPPPTRAVLERASVDLAALGREAQLGGALDQTLLLPGYDQLRAPALLLVGVGRDSGRTLETLRRAAAVAVSAAGRATSVASTLPQCSCDATPGTPADPAEPDAIVDIATLTGSAVAGLGPACTAVLSNTPALASRILAAASRAGETAWELPLVEDYRRFLDSDVADLRNATEQPGDVIQAALFLREFVAGRPWAHLDIAGPATLKEASYYQPKGATGCMVRTLLGLLKAW